MELLLESEHLEDYLGELPPIVVFNTPLVQAKIKAIEAQASAPEERAKLAFLVARDEVRHSFDTKDPVVTINAEDALEQHEGICFAKSHVLATLLRGMGIPTGFCYQRVVRKGTVESGYALHGLNAVHLPDVGWFRLDPRGNKPGIDSRFSTKEERLAYPIREELGEVDYPNVFTAPLPAVIGSMVDSKDSFELFFKRPEAL
jgi:transglutaminase-like putative cysteine protease